MLKMIEGPKFVIAVTLKKYYKEVTQCTIEYYFVRNNKETNNKKRINFRSSSGTYLMSIHGSRCIHFLLLLDRQIAVFHISSQISDVSCVSVLRNIKSLSIFIGCIELYFLLYRYQLQLFYFLSMFFE